MAVHLETSMEYAQVFSKLFFGSHVVIDRHLLGWNDSRITIPIFDREGRFAFFKLAKDPEDKTENSKILATLGAHSELYAWERVLGKPEQIIICEGEFDRLVLESRGFAAVTSTGGAATFRPEWAEAFREIHTISMCFDNDAAGRVALLSVLPLCVLIEERLGERNPRIAERSPLFTTRRTKLDISPC